MDKFVINILKDSGDLIFHNIMTNRRTILSPDVHGTILTSYLSPTTKTMKGIFLTPNLIIQNFPRSTPLIYPDIYHEEVYYTIVMEPLSEPTEKQLNVQVFFSLNEYMSPEDRNIAFAVINLYKTHEQLTSWIE